MNVHFKTESKLPDTSQNGEGIHKIITYKM